MSSPETRYDVHDKELLAIVHALSHWSHYLIGSPYQIKIFTDHRNLLYFRTRRTLSPRLLRRSLFLNQFNFIITYRRGELNVGADSLSRRCDLAPEGECESNKFDECLLPERFWEINSISRRVPERHLIRQVTSKQEMFEIIRSRHSSVLAGHQGRIRTYELVARDFHWPGMRSMIYDFVDSCPVCQKVSLRGKSPLDYFNPWKSLQEPGKM